MNAYFPIWLNALLFTANAVLIFLLTQAAIQANVTLFIVLGATNVGITALLAFQRGTTNAVRQLRGKPTVA